MSLRDFINKPTAKPRTLEDKINAESELGRTIFGPIPAGHQREFFEHRKNLWIWHESWTEMGQPREITLRYEVRPNGVFKKTNGSAYYKLEGMELNNFVKATRKYLELIKTQLYHA
ncbi:hypothetical protein IKL45_02705 [Candidatus Saccharibacteria bacterium]|nr:hypothetical protein [Candidatus Saccharibacteria bacterium]MBR6122065.1 hypothetical protein [Candidatus Saccharibacteria bacterium]